ncbi:MULTISPECIES: methionine ABC transporter ATP-binding protein [Jeotgalicoccus]|jgi:ABC-type metal ion transport system, ATPase component|uniref:ATP-binding cassette domain-containing protein n=1 Tax=Jeotgalicoccus nanhaiensis TaxID=568603 RepID=A0ABR9Y033_9STAP|nr:ATP-binding cassette domain-containing protein [Jeotgalicoccus nanhaiensis]MBF0754325.1 ATP-binding cassette domain-containing protein [Jeotgalicoccus nanhaiensis]TFU61254.1 ATP-binding cassette domain-containing protein [Jeotgalicoccus nanhaiensis]
MIELNGVVKQYQGRDGPFNALNDISVHIKKSEKFGIIGESGSGKSTLLRMINALETPDEGTVTVDGDNVGSLSPKQLRKYRKKIGMIFQQFNLLNNKTVLENITLPLKLHKFESALDIEEVLSFVGLSGKKDNYPGQLSGGQKQRVGIARALITNPKILLCDEPTSALDEKTTDEIVSVLRRAHEVYGMTIVVVTHELNVIKQLCDRTLVLEEGNIIDTIDIKQTSHVLSDASYYDRIVEVLKNE